MRTVRSATRRSMVAAALVATSGMVACGGDGNDAGPFDLVSSPEFVNLVIPGHRPVALVTATSDDPGSIAVSGSASLEGAVVEVLPPEIEPGDVAEIWVVLPELDQETPFRVVIEARRDADVRETTVDATGMPGTDDLGPTATDVAAVFLDELGGTVEHLPATADGLTDGTPVAGLLVVSHYAWFTEDAEIGLAWHVMVAPDDWAELTIRPRNELAPTQAYRLTSWSAALTGGDAQVVEITPPPEVTR